MRVCAFDLDHTLVRTPLDLRAMAADMCAHLERVGASLPAREERWRVGELLRFCRQSMPDHEAALWTLALQRERQAMAEATLEPGALDALAGVRRLGFATALWTNNAGVVTRSALERLGLREHFDVVVTRDEMRELKPDPDGWRVITGSLNGTTPAHGAPPMLSATTPTHSTPPVPSTVTPAYSTSRLLSATTPAHGTPPVPSTITPAYSTSRLLSAATPAHGTPPAVGSGLALRFMIGDSWVDGLAAAAAGVPFVAYRMSDADLTRWKISPVVTLTDLADLPRWLSAQ